MPKARGPSQATGLRVPDGIPAGQLSSGRRLPSFAAYRKVQPDRGHCVQPDHPMSGDDSDYAVRHSDGGQASTTDCEA
jgi:hypothetical protein